jgi:ubiquinone/menaquinone biosynthesis C-methylase UbiE
MTDHELSSDPAWTYERVFVPTFFRSWAEVLIDRAQLKPGERVLDLACGTGIVSRVAWHRLHRNVHIAGVDLNSDMLAVAREMIAEDKARVDLREGSATDLPFSDGSFDVVFIQQGLQFFPDKPAALAEVRRVLDDNGRVAVLAWAELDHQEFSKVEAQAVQKYLGVPAIHVPFCLGDPEVLRGLFVDAGYSDITVESHVHDARFPSAVTYFDTIVVAAAAADPELRKLDENQRSRLAEAVKSEMADTIEAHQDGEALVFPVEVNILTARKAG